MTTTDTTVSNLIINTMTQAQYNQITPSATELYLVTDSTITSSEVTNALGYTPTSPANVDGQWVASNVYLLNSTGSCDTTGTTIYLDDRGTAGAGKNYLPSDNYKYEVMFQIRLGCNASQSSSVQLFYGTDIISPNLDADGITVNKNGVVDAISITMPVGSGRYFKYKLSGTTSNTTVVKVAILGYRRIGTNS